MEATWNVIAGLYETHEAHEAVVAALLAELKKPSALRTEALEWAAKQLVLNYEHRQRRKIERRSEEYAPPPASNMSNATALAQAGWMKWVVPNLMKPLGQATKPELRAAAEKCRHHASGTLRSARFVDLVADQLPTDKKKVKQQLSDAELTSLYETACESD